MSLLEKLEQMAGPNPTESERERIKKQTAIDALHRQWEDAQRSSLTPALYAQEMLKQMQPSKFGNTYIPPIPPAPQVPPAPTSISMALSDFKRLPVQSGEELLTALTVMMRMEGVDVENSNEVVIRIRDGKVQASAEKTVKFDNLYGMKAIRPEMYGASTASGMTAVQAMANDSMKRMVAGIDEQLTAKYMEILAGGGTPEFIKIKQPHTFDDKIYVRDRKKIDELT